MYFGESIKNALDDVFNQNGEQCDFDSDLYNLADNINEYLGGNYDKRRRLYAILEGVTLVACSEEQEAIDKAAQKYTKAEIFDCISKVAFLAGALWAKVKQAGDYKPKPSDHCPLCGKEY